MLSSAMASASLDMSCVKMASAPMAACSMSVMESACSVRDRVKNRTRRKEKERHEQKRYNVKSNAEYI
jgi:hypothetical protein